MEKKIEYLIKTLVPQFIKAKYPQWEVMLEGYAKFVDSEVFSKIINITNNNDYNKMYPEFLDLNLDQYFNGVIDQKRVELTDDSKKLYIAISKLINNLKGNPRSIDFLFKYMSGASIGDDGEKVTLDDIIISYSEDKSFWNITQNPTRFVSPFTYKFLANKPLGTIGELIRAIHPAGFLYEVGSDVSYIEDLVIADTIDFQVVTSYIFNGKYMWNGKITFRPIKP